MAPTIIPCRGHVDGAWLDAIRNLPDYEAVVPLRVKEVGFVLLPVQEPLKPILAEPPLAASEPL